MKATMVLDRVEQLNALSNSKRLMILKALVNEPLSASALAKQVGLKSSQLYYHLNELTALELVEVVEEKQVRNLIERTYRATARHYSLASHLLPQQDGGEQAMKTLESFFEVTMQDVGAGLAAERLSQSDGSLWMMHREVYIKPSEYDSFRQKFQALLSEYAEEEEGTRGMTLTCVGYASHITSEGE